MKKMFVLLMLALFAGQALALTENVADDAVIYVTLLSQDPDPVEPGQFVDIRLKIQNLGNVAANDFSIEFIPQGSFSLESGEESLQTLATVNALQNDEQAQVIKYRVRVAREALEGMNKVKFKYSYKDKDDRLVQYTREYDVQVRTLDATLGIESITTSPSMLEPGKEGTVRIAVKNLADSSLRQVSVKLDLTLATLASASGSTSAGLSSLLDVLPFANVGSGTEKRVGVIYPGEQTFFEYDLVVYPDAASRVYKIPVIITFFDEQGEAYTKSDIVGIIVGSKPELEVVLDSYDITQPGTSGRVSFKFINKGVSDIKFVTARIGSDDDHKVLSADMDYVGNIDSDDFQTSDFRIYVEPTAGEKVTLPVEVTYKDSNNNDYTKKADLIMNLYTKQQAQQLGIQKQSTWPYVIMVIVIIVAGIFVYRAYRRRNGK
jgi:hypothetical protein